MAEETGDDLTGTSFARLLFRFDPGCEARIGAGSFRVAGRIGCAKVGGGCRGMVNFFSGERSFCLLDGICPSRVISTLNSMEKLDVLKIALW